MKVFAARRLPVPGGQLHRARPRSAGVTGIRDVSVVAFARQERVKEPVSRGRESKTPVDVSVLDKGVVDHAG
jgi:hypothetical protein